MSLRNHVITRNLQNELGLLANGRFHYFRRTRSTNTLEELKFYEKKQLEQSNTLQKSALKLILKRGGALLG